VTTQDLNSHFTIRVTSCQPLDPEGYAVTLELRRVTVTSATADSAAAGIAKAAPQAAEQGGAVVPRNTPATTTGVPSADGVSTARGYSVADIARLFRVGEDKVRGWIKRGELASINTSDLRCGKPRFVVRPESLKQFERSRAAATPPKPTPRRKKQTGEIDFYPD
jgi:hypothetical protein